MSSFIGSREMNMLDKTEVHNAKNMARKKFVKYVANFIQNLFFNLWEIFKLHLLKSLR